MSEPSAGLITTLLNQYKTLRVRTTLKHDKTIVAN